MLAKGRCPRTLWQGSIRCRRLAMKRKNTFVTLLGLLAMLGVLAACGDGGGEMMEGVEMKRSQPPTAGKRPRP